MIKDLRAIHELLKTRRQARKGLADHLLLRRKVFRMFEFPHLRVLLDDIQGHVKYGRPIPDYIRERYDNHYSRWVDCNADAFVKRQAFLDVLDETRTALNNIPLYVKLQRLDFTRNRPNESDDDRRRWEELGNWEQEPAFMEMSW